MFRRVLCFIGVLVLTAIMQLSLAHRDITFDVILSLALTMNYIVILIVCIEYLENRDKYKSKKSIAKLFGISLVIMAIGTILFFEISGTI